MARSGREEKITDPSTRHRVASEVLAMHKVALEEARRSLDDQIADLDAMRQRIMQYLAFIGAATAFLVGSGLQIDQGERTAVFYWLAALGTLLLVATIWFTVAVLLGFVTPWRPKVASWKFRLGAATLIEDWIDSETVVNEQVYVRKLALAYSSALDSNFGPLRQVQNAFVAALCCGALQLAVWTSIVWISR